jgi:hypothetical protein
VDLLESVAPTSAQMPLNWAREAQGVEPQYYCDLCNANKRTEGEKTDG